ncbi:endothelin-1 isoform X1 [Pelobates fuscus]|uniref:endothelin-1 isoform X1 n=2 Tax=Pelobates fuscus TaxID=191477 RepID=UPI002FE4B0D8
MMDLETIIYLLVALLEVTSGTVSGGIISMPEDGASVPDVKTDSSSLPSAPWRPRRYKRCSCSSLMDKECVYFCHLDIIWINTPERTVPYGLGGPRMRREIQDTDTESVLQSTSRCMCAKHTDKKCMDFCQTAELSVQSSQEKENGHIQEATKCSGLRLGVQCIQKQLQRTEKMKRSEDIKNSIERAFVYARLMNTVNEKKDETHHRTHKKRELWKHTKTTS